MSLYLLVVFTADEVQFLAACSSREGAWRHLARYVRERAAYKLHGAERRRVHRLLAEERTREGVDLYFSLIAARWDREHWKVQAVPPPDDEARDPAPARITASTR